MALFDKKNEKKFEQIVKEYNLEDLNREDLEVLYENSAIAGSGGINALFVQNYIIMRQLDRLNKNIEKLMEK